MRDHSDWYTMTKMSLLKNLDNDKTVNIHTRNSQIVKNKTNIKTKIKNWV